MVQDVLSTTAAVRLPEIDYNSVQQKDLSKSKKDLEINASDKQPKEFSAKVLDEAAKNVNNALSGSNTQIEFSIFKPTHEVMIKIKDNSTGKVIREIPSKKDLEMAAYMRKLSGIIVDTRV